MQLFRIKMSKNDKTILSNLLNLVVTCPNNPLDKHLFLNESAVFVVTGFNTRIHLLWRGDLCGLLADSDCNDCNGGEEGHSQHLTLLHQTTSSVVVLIERSRKIHIVNFF